MASQEPVTDVEKPGTKAPDPTSRPIIVSHGSVLQHDPMVSSSRPAPKPTAGTPAMTSNAPSNHKVLTPINEKKLAAASAPEPKAEPEAAPEESDSAAIEAVADQAAAKKKKGADEEQEKADKQRQEHVDHLIADKTYFLPIGKVTRKRHTRNSLIIILILLILLGGAGYVSYSLGLLKSLKLGS